jgi:cell division protein FtsQ
LSLSLGGLLLAATLYGLALGGHVGRGVSALAGLADSVTAHAGFGLSRVMVSGRHHTSREDILSALQVKLGQSLLMIDCQAVRARLLELAWVSDAHVRRILPGTLYIEVTERRPLAVWQHDGRLMLIDEGGHPIESASAEDLARFPHVVGAGAERHAVDLFRLLDHFAELESRVRAAVRVGDRRWNLVLDNGITVALPAENMATALSDALKLDREFALLSRDVTMIDLRLEDRWIIRAPSAGARAASGRSRET